MKLLGEQRKRSPLTFPDPVTYAPPAIINTMPERHKPDYTLKRVEPKPRTDGARTPAGQDSPIYRNLLELMKTPGEPGVIASYASVQSARSVADQLRAARDGRDRKTKVKRSVPSGRWEIFHQKLDDGSGGVFAIYLSR